VDGFALKPRSSIWKKLPVAANDVFHNVSSEDARPERLMLGNPPRRGRNEILCKSATVYEVTIKISTFTRESDIGVC
jgi:hypothetical protein